MSERVAKAEVIIVGASHDANSSASNTSYSSLSFNRSVALVINATKTSSQLTPSVLYLRLSGSSAIPIRT